MCVELCPFGIIPPTLHTERYLNTALFRRLGGNLQTNQCCIFIWGGVGGVDRKLLSPILFQNEFYTQCDLVRLLSVSNVRPFPYTVAAYFFFLVFPSPLFPFYLSLNNVFYRRQFLRKIWPTQSAFFIFIVCRIFMSSLTQCNNSFLAQSVQRIVSTLLHHYHHISYLSRCYGYIFIYSHEYWPRWYYLCFVD